MEFKKVWPYSTQFPIKSRESSVSDTSVICTRVAKNLLVFVFEPTFRTTETALKRADNSFAKTIAYLSNKKLSIFTSSYDKNTNCHGVD